MSRPIIYADVCCLNRPLDDLQQSRIRLEAEAILTILQNCEAKKWSLLSSDALRFEIAKNTDPSKKEQLDAILSLANVHLFSTPDIESQAQAFIKLGFKPYDALHIAFAQTAPADVFLTTDDRLLRNAKKHPHLITIPVENPVIWLMNTLQEQTQNNEAN